MTSNRRPKNKPKNKLKQIQIPENLIHILAVISVIPACFYQVRLVNTFGDAGSAYYFVAFDWFFLFFSLTGLGLFRAVSDMVFSRLERGNVKGAAKVIRSAVWNGLGVSLLFCLIGYALSAFLMQNVMHLPLAALAVKGFLPALLPLAVLFAISGGMDGFGYAKGPDTVCFVFCMALFLAVPLFTVPLYEYGEKVGALLQNAQYGPAYGAQGGSITWIVAAAVALVAALACRWFMNSDLKKMETFHDTLPLEKEKKIYRSVFLKSMSAVAPFVFLNLALIGQAMMFLRIQESKGQDGWMQQWGIFAGKSRIFLFIPVLLAIFYALHMLPELKTAYLRRNLKRSRERYMVSLRCIALMMVPLAVVLAVMGEPLISLFFKEGEIQLAAQLLRIGSICIIFYGLAVMLGTILLSMNMTLNFIIGTVFSVVIHLVALYGMLHFLDIGIYGVVYGNIILAFLLCCCYFFEIRRQVRLRISWLRIFLAPCIAGAIMAAVCALLSLVILKNAPGLLNVLLGMFISILVYFIIVLVLKGATARELRSCPGGEALIAFARLLRLM